MERAVFFGILLVTIVFLIIGARSIGKKDKNGRDSVSGEVLGWVGIVLAITICLVVAYAGYMFFSGLQNFHGM